MKQILIFLAAMSLALAACNRPAADSTNTATAAKPKAAAERKPHLQPVTPEEIAQIEASGKTGLWSEVTEVCRKPGAQGIRTTLTWNVTDKGVDRVVVYVVGKDGTERHFGKGGPVGRNVTGPWLRPGLVFKLRGPDKQEVAAVTIGEKQC